MLRLMVLPVLVFCLVGAGCKQESTGASRSASAAAPAAKLTVERARDVDFVWYAVRNGEPVGGTSPAKVLLKPNPSGDVRVAVYEEYSGSAGNQWRASAWVASFLAASTLGRDLTDFEFGVSTGGFVDGPSAGGLTTAAFLSAMQDVPISAVATMTGTVNPDGSIGPVGGLTLKLAGAAEKGKKVFGYPVGQRYDVDPKTRRLVDLQALGRELQIEAREVRDIYDAYQLLTGQTLTRPTPLPASAMDVSPKYFQRMQAKTTAWLARAQASMSLVKQADKSGMAQKLGLLGRAAESYEKANNYQRQGMVPAAYSEAMQAAALVELTGHFTKQAEATLKGDLSDAILELRSLAAIAADEDAFRATLATAEPATAAETMSLLEAYEAAANARAFIALGKQQEAELEAILAGLGQGKVPQEWLPAVRSAGAKKKEVLGVLVLTKALYPTLYYVMAKYYVDGARDLFEAREPAGKPLKLDAAVVARLARSYMSAAKANLDYYDSLILQTQAERQGTTLAAAQAHKAQQDPTYLQASMVMRLALANREKTDLPNALSNLAAAVDVYMRSSALVAREYSVGARPNKEGKLVIDHDKAFMAMLDLAEEKAREQAAVALEVTGVVPGPAQSGYQLARALREGDTEQKLQALEHFWGSSTSSQLAVMLSRGAAAAPAR
jgi:uncharacterized protein